MRSGKGITFFLTGNGIRLHRAMIRELLSLPDWGERFSEGFVAKKLDSAVAQALLDESEGTTVLDNDPWLEELGRYSDDQTVYLRLIGLTLPEGPQQIGNVELVAVTDEVRESLLERAERVIETLKHTEEEKVRIRELYESNVVGHLAGQVVAKYTVTAEPQRAIERAEEEARRAVDVLRFSIPAVYPSGYRVEVGLEGDVSRELSWVAVFGSAGMTANHRVKGSLQPFELSAETLARMDEIGALAVSEILTKQEGSLSDMERTILRGVHWFGSAQTQHELENKFLNLVTCVETFLTPRDGNPIGTAIAEGIAILLATGVDNRRAMKKEVKRLYRLRSGVSHGGKKAVLDSDVETLQGIAGSLAMSLISRRTEWNSQAELLRWIEDQKFA